MKSTKSELMHPSPHLNSTHQYNLKDLTYYAIPQDKDVKRNFSL